MKLIDILNMISKGELKEGTRVKYDNETYEYDGEYYLLREGDFCLLEDIYLNNLNDECELIEPDHFADDGEMEEKIEELDKQRIKMEQDDVGVGFTLGNEWSDLKAKIQVLQELMEDK